MQTIDTLGFESALVLMKLGFDLRATLAETADAPIPGTMLDIVDQIPMPERADNVVITQWDQPMVFRPDSLM